MQSYKEEHWCREVLTMMPSHTQGVSRSLQLVHRLYNRQAQWGCTQQQTSFYPRGLSSPPVSGATFAKVYNDSVNGQSKKLFSSVLPACTEPSLFSIRMRRGRSGAGGECLYIKLWVCYKRKCLLELLTVSEIPFLFRKTTSNDFCNWLAAQWEDRQTDRAQLFFTTRNCLNLT